MDELLQNLEGLEPDCVLVVDLDLGEALLHRDSVRRSLLHLCCLYDLFRIYVYGGIKS